MSKDHSLLRRSFVTLALLLCCAVAIPFAKAATTSSSAMPELPGGHHVVFQVSSANPAVMNLALNNVVNVENAYSKLGQVVHVELVAYGPGLNMLLADRSPVKERIAQLKASMPDVTFSACNVTLQTLEKKEGKTLAILPQARIVSGGVVRIMTLQERGWSYIKP